MFVLLCIMLLSGCASPHETYNQQLQNWVGMSQESLFYTLGEPNNVDFITPGTKVVTYVKINNGPIDGNTEPYAGEIQYAAMETPSYGLPPENNTYYCKTSFTIENNEIVNYTFNGDDCIADN